MNFVTSFFVETDGARVNCMQATWDLVTDRYSVRNNLVLQFKRDEIDQSPRLAETLFNRFGRDGELEYSRQVSPRAWGGWGAGDRGGVAGRRVAWSCPRECFSGGCFIPDECFYLLLLSVFFCPVLRFGYLRGDISLFFSVLPTLTPRPACPFVWQILYLNRRCTFALPWPPLPADSNQPHPGCKARTLPRTRRT